MKSVEGELDRTDPRSRRHTPTGAIRSIDRPPDALESFSASRVRPMLAKMAEAKPRIYYWFVVTGTPQGGAPIEVRAQWDGVALPVREPRPMEGPTPFRGREIGNLTVRHRIDDGVPVDGEDAVRALRLFGRTAASAWWRECLHANSMGDRLVFRSYEGRLIPPGRAVDLFPELADFDDC